MVYPTTFRANIYGTCRVGRRGGKMLFKSTLTAYYNVVIRDWPHKIEVVGGKNFRRVRPNCSTI